MPELTAEQRAAVEAQGKVIVSASAGSGKTFVMIEKLSRAIESGADLDGVLAVTFTKKAAANMKNKLRESLIKRLEGASADKKTHIKAQISKISSANISTIHSFCARLLRTYFYALDIDGGFDIIADDDPTGLDLRACATDNLFERLYAQDDPDFMHLLNCFTKKRSDNSLKQLLYDGYDKLRTVARYRDILASVDGIYTERGFNGVCAALAADFGAKYSALLREVENFRDTFPVTSGAKTYNKIFGEMCDALEFARTADIFTPLPQLAKTNKPRDGEGEEEASERYKKFRTRLNKRYNEVRGDIGSRDWEYDIFIKSGQTAKAFARLMTQFDDEYTAVKRDENKLDYNDLEHLTLQLLQREDIRREINSVYEYVYVDEYQDVNPVQEEIISSLGRQVFLVGDVKQAIYGFRGSKSLFFAEKYNRFEGGDGVALRLSSNFRSCKRVLDFCNTLFSCAMRSEVCGFDYAGHAEMTAGAAYPPDSGFAGIHILGEEEKEVKERGVYSVLEDGRQTTPSREGLAVLNIVKQELQSEHYDIQKGQYVKTQPGDICILSRKNKGDSVGGIVRTLREAGYSVSGAQDSNVCALPEVKEMLDILSLIDNAEQDVPLVTCMLSPLGGFSEDELAAVRIAFKADKLPDFRSCVKRYAAEVRDGLARKIATFLKKLENYRDLAQILTAEELIDRLLSDSGLEAAYSGGNGEKLKNVLRIAEEGPRLTVAALLEKIRAGGYKLEAPAAAPTDSIKVMTMHAAKGLEFSVVIVADICRAYRGRENADLTFSEDAGFVFKCYSPQDMMVYPTLLRRLCRMRADREELKNELNLFYVACTRAMCNLHIITAKAVEYSPYEASNAKNYAQTFDISEFPLYPADFTPDGSGEEAQVEVLPPPDQAVLREVESRFMRRYLHADSVDLPVKSSASAILKSRSAEEPYYVEHRLFGGEGETGTERGTAYHRFLELCNFALNGREEVKAQLDNFVNSGRITAEQAALLNADELYEILNMPIFGGLEGARLFREREFLCRLKACDLFETEAEDYVLVQGAIDLLAVFPGEVRIIDYKYSQKSDEKLVETYKSQLALYKRAVAASMKVSPSTISTAIVNIYLRRQIILE